MSRKLVQKYAPHALFVFHNGILDTHQNAKVWNDLFADDDMENVVMDVHVYAAFGDTRTSTVKSICDTYEDAVSNNVKDVKYPVWVGEWSLATDVCA